MEVIREFNGTKILRETNGSMFYEWSDEEGNHQKQFLFDDNMQIYTTFNNEKHIICPRIHTFLHVSWCDFCVENTGSGGQKSVMTKITEYREGFVSCDKHFNEATALMNVWLICTGGAIFRTLIEKDDCAVKPIENSTKQMDESNKKYIIVPRSNNTTTSGIISTDRSQNLIMHDCVLVRIDVNSDDESNIKYRIYKMHEILNDDRNKHLLENVMINPFFIKYEI